MGIHAFNGFQHFHGITVLIGSLDEGLHIFREARAAISASGIQELATNAGIATDALSNHIHVGSHQFAEVGNVVHERNARSQHRVGSIFRHLGTGNVHENNAEVIHHEWLVETRQQLLGTIALHTNHHTVGTHEVLDGIPLLQEFRIAGYIELYVGATLVKFTLNGLAHLLRRTHRHRALGDHNHIFIKVLADGFSHLQYISKVGRAVFVGRSTHGREHYLLIVEHVGQRGCELQSTGTHILQYQVFKARFVDGYVALLQTFNLRSIDIHTRHLSTRVGKASSRHQSNISCSYNCYIHK